MQVKVDAPTIRQAAELMPAGPDRDALHARAREYFEAHNGPFIERRIAGIQNALELIWAAQQSQAMLLGGSDGQRAGLAEPPKHLREMLRCENQLDRLNRSLEATWEQAFKFAREAIFRESRKRLATPVYEANESVRTY